MEFIHQISTRYFNGKMMDTRYGNLNWNPIYFQVIPLHIQIFKSYLFMTRGKFLENFNMPKYCQLWLVNEIFLNTLILIQNYELQQRKVEKPFHCFVFFDDIYFLTLTAGICKTVV